MLDAGGADTYTQRAIAGAGLSEDSATCPGARRRRDAAMSYGSLEEPAAKLRWAAEQYRRIKNEQGGADHQSIKLRVESSEGGLRYDMYAEDVPPLSEELPLILGDIYHNLRGALDYLIYQLHERHYRGNIPDQVVRDSQFPILSSPRVAQGGVPAPPSSWKEVRNLGKKERAAIAWLQPYNNRRDKIEGVRIHLRDINRINNIDKHRRLHVTRSVAQAVPTMASLPDYGLTQRPAFDVLIESGLLIDTWKFERMPPSATMNGIKSFRSAAIFDLDGDRIDAFPHLAGSIASVVLVLERFSSLFPPLAPGSLVFPWVRVTEPFR